MKILVVMGGFFPGRKYGGPPVSVNNFCSLMRAHDCYIVTLNHDMNENKAYSGIKTNEWIDRGNCKVCYLEDRDYVKKQFEKIISEIKPDVLYLQGLFQSCILPCLCLAKKYNIRVLLAPRGELCEGAFRKKYKKVPYIQFLRVCNLLDKVYFQSTSNEETEAIIKHLHVDSSHVVKLTNVPSISTHDYLIPEKKRGKAEFIFLSRVHPKKGLIDAIGYLMHIKGEVKFDIYGPLEDISYWKQCQSVIDQLPKNISVEYKGLISHEQVHATFSKYDAFIFPTHSENYGHVIAEALIVGCPVIVSDTTPWNDIEEYKAGWVNDRNNKEGFISAIQTIVNSDSNFYRENAKSYAELKLNISCLRDEYVTAFESICR